MSTVREKRSASVGMLKRHLQDWKQWRCSTVPCCSSLHHCFILIYRHPWAMWQPLPGNMSSRHQSLPSLLAGHRARRLSLKLKFIGKLLLLLRDKSPFYGGNGTNPSVYRYTYFSCRWADSSEIMQFRISVATNRRALKCCLPISCVVCHERAVRVLFHCVFFGYW